MRFARARRWATVLIVTGVLASVTATASGAPQMELGPNAAAGGPLNYLALGDSYSSGEGAPLETREAPLGWTGDTLLFGGCHRSQHAYPVRVWGVLDRQDPGWGVSFAACSGATTDALTNPFRRDAGQRDPRIQPEEPQLNAINNTSGRPADLITLGFGGNDIGFAPIVASCLAGGTVDRAMPAGVVFDAILREVKLRKYISGPLTGQAQTCKGRWVEKMQEALPPFEAKYREQVRTLKGERYLKTGGKLMLVGYPRPFPNKPPIVCTMGDRVVFTRETMSFLNTVADELNKSISRVARAQGVSFIDTSQVLQGHDLCINDGAKRWMNRLITPDIYQSFHPKYGYHEQVARQVLDCWRRCAPTRAPVQVPDPDWMCWSDKPDPRCNLNIIGRGDPPLNGPV